MIGCDPIASHVACALTRVQPMRCRLGLVRQGRAGAETGKELIEERCENSGYAGGYEHTQYHQNLPCYQPYYRIHFKFKGN